MEKPVHMAEFEMQGLVRPVALELLASDYRSQDQTHSEESLGILGHHAVCNSYNYTEPESHQPTAWVWQLVCSLDQNRGANGLMLGGPRRLYFLQKLSPELRTPLS